MTDKSSLAGDKKYKAPYFLFPSRTRKSPHLTTRQYAGIVKSWIKLIGREPDNYGTYSMRRTKGTLIYRRTKIYEPYNNYLVIQS